MLTTRGQYYPVINTKYVGKVDAFKSRGLLQGPSMMRTKTMTTTMTIMDDDDGDDDDSDDD